MHSGVAMFGSFVVDLTTRQKNLPVPGQTIIGSWFKMGPGGKGSNQAVAAHRAGADVKLITKLGKDPFASVALDFYRAEGIATEHVLIDDAHATGIALIMVDEVSGQNQIVVVPAACMHVTDEDIERSRPVIESAKILLLQMEINLDALCKVIEIAHNAGVLVVLNPAPAASIPDEALAMVDVVTPNESEAQLLTGVEVKNEGDAGRAAEHFLKKGVKNVVITLGAMGAFATDGARSELVGRLEVDAVDTTGAGDAFNGGFAAALAEGKDLFEALRFGNATGALSVTRYGTAPSMPTREEIFALYRANYGE